MMTTIIFICHPTIIDHRIHVAMRAMIITRSMYAHRVCRDHRMYKLFLFQQRSSHIAREHHASLITRVVIVAYRVARADDDHQSLK